MTPMEFVNIFMGIGLPVSLMAIFFVLLEAVQRLNRIARVLEKISEDNESEVEESSDEEPLPLPVFGTRI